MKKYFARLLFVASLMALFSVSACTPALKTETASTQAPEIEINGVKVNSLYSFVEKDTIFVGIEDFFEVLNQDYTLNAADKAVSFDGKSIALKMHKDGYVASIDEVAKLISDVGYSTHLTKEKDGSVYLLVLPKGVVKLTPSIPKMGEHWAIPNEMPVGPIYGVEKGKLIFIEQMPAQQFFTDGESLVDLAGMKGLPSPSINHTNIEFQEHGHEGFEATHYDIHHYFITPSERDAIKGDPMPSS